MGNGTRFLFARLLEVLRAALCAPMEMKWVLSILFVVGAVGAHGQGMFQNLDFEEANIVPISGSTQYPYAITTANALPNWTVEYGTVAQTQILYNDPTLGTTAVTLYANGYSGFPGPILQGDFSVLLQGFGINGIPTAASISQTGLIPASSQSLFFEASGAPEQAEVSIGNDLLTLFPVGVAANYTIYGANVSAWSGQAAQLTFSSYGGNWLIDDISFSPNPITTPEPDALTLTGIGGLVFGIYRRIQAKRKC